MFMSRQLVKTPKTKFRRQAEEKVTKKPKLKQQIPNESVKRFDLWEDDSNGC
jgi:hypothetical protein